MVVVGVVVVVVVDVRREQMWTGPLVWSGHSQM